MTITDTQIKLAAAQLAVDTASIRAVDEIESRGSGFDARGRVKILFEPHIFSRETGGRHDKDHPEISYRGWIAKAPSYQRDQHEVFAEAAKVDEVAAIKACSWGRYQIMGFNHSACGYPDARSFAAGMRESEGAHLAAFVAFIRANPRMHKALKAKDWTSFAIAYNGPAQGTHRYDQRLKAAYEAALKQGK